MEPDTLESLLEAFLCSRNTGENITIKSDDHISSLSNISERYQNTYISGNRFCNATLRNLTSDIHVDLFSSIISKLNVYATPLLILFGVLGNLFSFLVFTTTHLKRQSSSVYLASLALVDALFLLVLTIVWLSWIKIPLFHKAGWCQITMYLNYVTNFLSSYLVVAFTVERYILVGHPFQRDKLCTTNRAMKVAGSLLIISAIAYSSATWTTGVQKFPLTNVCMPLPQYFTLLTVITVLDFVVTTIIPSFIIVSLNIRIAYQIVNLSKSRKCLEQVTVLQSRFRSDFSGSNEYSSPNRVGNKTIYLRHNHIDHTTIMRANSTNPCRSTGENRRSHQSMRISHRRMRAQHRTARMLLIVSSVFVILKLPRHSFKIYTFIESSRQGIFAAERHTLRWQELLLLLYHLNFAINFLLYSLSGSTFRKALRMLCCKMLHWFQKHLCTYVPKLDQ